MNWNKLILKIKHVLFRRHNHIKDLDLDISLDEKLYKTF